MCIRSQLHIGGQNFTCVRGNDRFRCTHSVALANSSVIPIIHSVDKLSTMVAPMPANEFLPCFDSGISSSMPPGVGGVLSGAIKALVTTKAY